MASEITDIRTVLATSEKAFLTQNKYGLTFHAECLFARQQVTKNKYVWDTFTNNPQSLRDALLNLSAIGISLNPATAHAYLVPRDGKICLDISYRGLVKLATDAGSIKMAKAVLVYEGDTFKWRGPAELPIHEADVFNTERMNPAEPLEKLRGGYCIAWLPDGTVIVDVMSAGEILEIRNASKASKGPWNGPWGGEMAKKSLVKRASKSWPQTAERERFDLAVETVNAHEGIEIEATPTKVSDYLQHSQEQKSDYNRMLQGRPIDFYFWWNSLDPRIQTSLINSFDKGEKGKGRELTVALDKQGRESAMEIADMVEMAVKANDTVAYEEAIMGLTDDQIDMLNLSSEAIMFVREFNSVINRG